MNDTLKAVGNIGAELGAAKAENDRLREALRWYEGKVAECRKIGSLGDNARQALDRDGGFRARDALSQQAEPTDTYTAVEMATAAAQGFRDGQAAVEPATAQDEREAPIVVATAILGGIFHGGSGPELGEIDIEVCTSALEKIQCETVNSSDDAFLPLMTVAQHERIVAALTRPAQTEQQPIGYACQADLEWEDEPIRICRERFRDWQLPVYAGPIAQTEQQPVAYLDLGIGGYMDLGTDLTDEQLEGLPWGRHMLGIIGTYGAEGYAPAAPSRRPPRSWSRVGLIRTR